MGGWTTTNARLQCGCDSAVSWLRWLVGPPRLPLRAIRSERLAIGISSSCVAARQAENVRLGLTRINEQLMNLGVFSSPMISLSGLIYHRTEARLNFDWGRALWF